MAAVVEEPQRLGKSQVETRVFNQLAQQVKDCCGQHWAARYSTRLLRESRVQRVVPLCLLSQRSGQEGPCHAERSFWWWGSILKLCLSLVGQLLEWLH